MTNKLISKLLSVIGIIFWFSITKRVSVVIIGWYIEYFNKQLSNILDK